MINRHFFKNSWRGVCLLSACFVLIGGVVSSCKKNASSIGSEVLSVDALLASGGIDTFQMITYSVDEDSIATDFQVYGTLGAFHDPQLGIMNASIYTQLNIGGKVTLPVGAQLDVIDSVVLSLSYGGYYGKLDPQTFEVYELDEQLYLDSVYYRSTTKALTGSDLVLPNSATQTPDTKSVIYLGPNGTDSVKPQLRLRLEPSFGTHFVQGVIDGNSAFNSTKDFLSSGFFKGLHIKVSNGNPALGTGAMLYFLMGNTDTRLTVYFKLQGETDQRTLVFSLRDGSTFFNHVEKDFTGHHVAQVLSNPLNGQSNFYVQSFGLLGVVEFPTLTNLSSKTVLSNCLIHLPILSHSASKYTPFSTLTLFIKNELGGYTPVSNAGYLSSQKGYVFDVRAYAQAVISGKVENKPLYIFPSVNTFSSSGNRVVFNGPATVYKMKPKVVLKYTEFK